jgi:hypothetical protein
MKLDNKYAQIWNPYNFRTRVCLTEFKKNQISLYKVKVHFHYDKNRAKLECYKKAKYVFSVLPNTLA